MRSTLRSLSFGLAAVLGLATQAQQTLYVFGQIAPCNPANVGSTVTIEVTSDQGPPVTTTTVVGPNCSYNTSLTVDYTVGQITATGPCGNGLASVPVPFEVEQGGGWDFHIDINCDSGTPCQACFTYEQYVSGAPYPFIVTFDDCNTGGAGPFTYSWDFGDGTPPESTLYGYANHNFVSGAGTYTVCLDLADANGCASQVCHDVVIDADGMVVPIAPPGYQVHVSGNVSPCTLLDNTVTVRCTSCTPWVEASVPVDADCNYSATLDVDALDGIIVVATGCSNGLVPNNTMHYIINPSVGETSLTLNLSCTPLPMEACFTVEQTAPFTAQFINCSTGCLAPFTFVWDFSGPGGGAVEGDAVTHTFPGPGTYTVCLNVAGADGCTGQTCQQVVVDADGNINPDPGSCEAGFWTIQAYQTDPVSGDPTPIAGEVWLWNLTSPEGTYEFLWEFGDGSASTEPYPTHTYVGNGPYTLCLTASTNNCSDTYCEDIEIDDDGLLRDGGFILTVLHDLPSGIQQAPAIADLRTWPNPVADELNVGLSSRLKGLVELRVTDLSGRAVMSEPRALATGTNTLRLSMDRLEPGVYLLHVGDRTNGSTVRFVKTR